MASSINPNIVTNAVVIWGFPKKLSIPKYMKVQSKVITTIKVAAINFPKTIFVILSGDVSSNCSVPVFLSSAIVLMVRMGTIKVNIVAPE